MPRWVRVGTSARWVSYANDVPEEPFTQPLSRSSTESLPEMELTEQEVEDAQQAAYRRSLRPSSLPPAGSVEREELDVDLIIQQTGTTLRRNQVRTHYRNSGDIVDTIMVLSDILPTAMANPPAAEPVLPEGAEDRVDPEQVDGPRQVPEYRGPRSLEDIPRGTRRINEIRYGNVDDVLEVLGLHNAPLAPPRSHHSSEPSDDGFDDGLDLPDDEESIAQARERLRTGWVRGAVEPRENANARQRAALADWIADRREQRASLEPPVIVEDYTHRRSTIGRLARAIAPPTPPVPPVPRHVSHMHKLVCHYIDLHERNGKKGRVPNEFLCPLSLHAMCDPVVLSDGILYEREYLRRCLLLEYLSPITRGPILHGVVFPCKAMITMMESWVRQQVEVPEGGSLELELKALLVSAGEQLEDLEKADGGRVGSMEVENLRIRDSEVNGAQTEVNRAESEDEDEDEDEDVPDLVDTFLEDQHGNRADVD